MPIHKEGSGYQWGQHGHVYSTKAGAEKQAEAAHANGFHDSVDTQDCAGMLFVTDTRRFLLVHRKDRDEWETPGGHVQEGEDPITAAMREAFEEIGPHGYGEAELFQSFGMPSGTYSLFRVASKEFEPTLSEHDAFQWVTAHALPESVHPNTKEAIEATAGTETAIAKSMIAGLFPSPQRIQGAWLFDIRITGTGLSLRSGKNEWVYRPPEYYLNREFLERCNGIPVLFEHPSKGMTTEEWRNRAIGAVVLPYLPLTDDEVHRQDDVWAIARIYDDDAAELMMTTHPSTSPGVSFGEPLKPVVNDDGSHLLIEGNPSHIDHVAVCAAGVWDKGETPRGINN